MGTREENLMAKAMKTAQFEIDSIPKRIEKAIKKGEKCLEISYFSTNKTNDDVFRIIEIVARQWQYNTSIKYGVISEEKGYLEDILTISWSK